MNPIESVASVLRNLRNFNGRASRSEFWWFFIIALIVGLALMGRFLWFAPWHFFDAQLLFMLLSVALLLPVLYLIIIPAVTVRRLHDTGRSARWLLICVGIVAGWGIIVGAVALGASTSDDGLGAVILALFLGGLWVLVSLLGLAVLTSMLCLPGTAGPNLYGPDPLRPELATGVSPGPDHSAAALYEAGGTAGFGDASASPDSSLERETPARLYCTQCGTQMQIDARFCTFCGTPVRRSQA